MPQEYRRSAALWLAAVLLALANRAAIKTMLDAKKEERSVELIRRHSGEEAAERYKTSRAARKGDH